MVGEHPGRRAFVYGTLMAPDLLQALLGRRVCRQPAWLPGYRRGALRGVSDPAIVPDPGGAVHGLLTGPLSAAHWQRLDRYESDAYQRQAVRLHLPGGEHTAWAYVLHPSLISRLARRPWSFSAWRRSHLATALARVTRDLGPD